MSIHLPKITFIPIFQEDDINHDLPERVIIAYAPQSKVIELFNEAGPSSSGAVVDILRRNGIMWQMLSECIWISPYNGFITEPLSLEIRDRR